MRLAVPRLLIGLVVLICAEVFSGASIQVGIWAPWTWLMTYWLYFAHFFVLCTLAVRTGRTSLGALYLWGVLFGLYESWITKVIWFGYGGDGKLALGSIGPYRLLGDQHGAAVPSGGVVSPAACGRVRAQSAAARLVS